MNWAVYFIGGSRDMQKHIMENPRPVFEGALLEQLIPVVQSNMTIETAITYKKERYSFRPISEGLGVYVYEETI